jgi:hypothetical protein
LERFERIAAAEEGDDEITLKIQFRKVMNFIRILFLLCSTQRTACLKSHAGIFVIDFLVNNNHAWIFDNHDV